VEEAITDLLSGGLGDTAKLAELGHLGGQLILQRGIEQEVTAFRCHARYERMPAARGPRNGVRRRRVQTAEGEVQIQVPQLRNTA
jgi:transposase-like protein